MTADFWLRIALSTLVILGIWNALDPEMILAPVGRWLERRPAWFSKPMGLCLPCMASTYGTAMWFLTGGDWRGLPTFVLALSGALVIVVRKLLN